MIISSKTHRNHLIIIALLFCITTIPLLASAPNSWDAAQFTLGVEHYSVHMHQPHPPGYPLFILTAKLFALVVSAHTAVLIVSMLFALTALVVWYTFVLRIWNKPWLAFVASIALLVNPLFWTYREVALTYTVDLCAAVTLGYFTYELLQRLKARSAVTSWLYASAGAVALFAGFRPSLFVLLFPLLLFQWGIAYRVTRNWRPVAYSILILVGIISAWAIPLLAISGGIQGYQTDSARLFREAAEATSVFYGAPWKTTWLQIIQVYDTLVAALNVLLIPLAITIGASLYQLIRTLHNKGREIIHRINWQMVLFGTTWVIGPLIVYCLIHFGQIGYAVIFLPGCYLLITACINKLTDISQKLWKQAAITALALGLIVNASVFVVLTPTFAHPDYVPEKRIESMLQTLARKNAILFKLNASTIQREANRIIALDELVTNAYDPSEVLVVAGRNIMYPAQINRLPVRNDEIFRELSATLPEYTVAQVAPGYDYYLQSHGYITNTYEDTTTITVPDTVRYVIFALNQLAPADYPNGILIERRHINETEPYFIGVMDKAFTFQGFTIQHDRDRVAQ